MSIASRITAMQGHIEDTYDMLEVGGADLTNIDKNLNNISSIIKEQYLDYMNNGTDEIWNNWDKTTQNNVTEATLNGTIEAPIKIDLKGNTSQDETATPDNPQDVHVVTGDCSIIKTGKNLFDKDSITSGYLDTTGVINENSNYRVSDYIPVSSNGSYTYSGTAIQSSWAAKLCFYNSNKEFQSYLNIQNTSTTINIPANVSYIRTTVKLDELPVYQLEQGSTATSYEAYKSTTYPLTLGNIELCKIGDYQDKIYKDNGKWYLYKTVGKTIINGSETINVEDGRYQISVHLNAPSNTNWHTVLLLSNYFKGSSLNGLKNANNQITYHPYNLVPAIYSTDFANATELSNFLTQKYNNNEPLYMFYALATPTTTEITDGTLIYQLEALKNAKSYSNITNITQSNADLPFILDISALTELSN